MIQKSALLLFSIYFILSFSHPLYFNCDPINEFKCWNGMCIPIERGCDNILDCDYGEDESDCNYLNKCEAGLFMCQDGECEPRESRCNGKRDCADGSDELGCQKEVAKSPKAQKPKSRSKPQPTHPIISVCDPHKEFKCNDGKCIPIEYHCDNISECDNGEDEKDCHYLHNCEPGLFMCASGECLRPEVKCNGAKNCYDGSDEFGCPTIKPHFLPKANAHPNPSKIAANKSSQTPIPISNPTENCKNNDSYFWLNFFLFLLFIVSFGSFSYFLCGRYPYVRYRRDLFVDHVTNVFKKSPAKSFLPKCDAEHGPNVSLLEESPALS